MTTETIDSLINDVLLLIFRFVIERDSVNLHDYQSLNLVSKHWHELARHERLKPFIQKKRWLQKLAEISITLNKDSYKDHIKYCFDKIHNDYITKKLKKLPDDFKILQSTEATLREQINFIGFLLKNIEQIKQGSQETANKFAYVGHADLKELATNIGDFLSEYPTDTEINTIITDAIMHAYTLILEKYLKEKNYMTIGNTEQFVRSDRPVNSIKDDITVIDINATRLQAVDKKHTPVTSYDIVVKKLQGNYFSATKSLTVLLIVSIFMTAVFGNLISKKSDSISLNTNYREWSKLTDGLLAADGIILLSLIKTLFDAFKEYKKHKIYEKTARQPLFFAKSDEEQPLLENDKVQNKYDGTNLFEQDDIEQADIPKPTDRSSVKLSTLRLNK